MILIAPDPGSIFDLPSHTASKHRSSHVMITSNSSLLSWNRSGEFLIFRFLSNISNIPLDWYLSLSIQSHKEKAIWPTLETRSPSN